MRGWIEALSSKRSKGVAFGDQENLEKLTEWIYLYSLSGDIRDLELEWGEYEYEGEDFGILA